MSLVARECCAFENALCHAAQYTWRLLQPGVLISRRVSHCLVSDLNMSAAQGVDKADVRW